MAEARDTIVDRRAVLGTIGAGFVGACFDETDKVIESFVSAKAQVGQRTVSKEEVDADKARKSLMGFTLYTNPRYQAAPIHLHMSSVLDRFVADCVAKKSPRLIISVPPRHGKSELVSRRLPAYVFGRYPDMQLISCSYSADLSSRFNREVQRIMDSPLYERAFPDTKLNQKNVKTTARGSYLRNSDIFEIVNHLGSYRSAGVGGGIGGMGADMLIIDDPVKDVQEAQSDTVRQTVKDWFAGVAYTRLMPGGGIIICMTRWHMDDLAGHCLKQSGAEEFSDVWEEIRFPAIAEDGDILGRKEGEALDPERYPLLVLNRYKATLGPWQFSALYQQRPVPREGAMFKREWFSGEGKRVPAMPIGVGVRRCRGWDLAASVKKRGKYTAGVRMSLTKDNVIYIEHALRARKGPGDVESYISATANADRHYCGGNVRQSVPQDPAQAGLVQKVAYAKALAGHDVRFSPEGGQKVDRANPLSAQAQAGNVRIVETGNREADAWIEPFLDELCLFPGGEFSDQTDAASRAYGELIAMPVPQPDAMFLVQVGQGEQLRETGT